MENAIRGEKVFTKRVRKRMVRRVITLSQMLGMRALQLRAVAHRLAAVTTKSELRKIDITLCVLDEPINELRVFYEDDRSRCHYCSRLSHGGVSGLLLSERKRFACYREECVNKYDRDIALDKKKHPRRYRRRSRYNRSRRMERRA